MAWPLLDPLAREEMVCLTRLNSHELRVQAATTGVRSVEDLLRIAHSLEAVGGKETSRRARQGHTQARFTEVSEGYESDATRIVYQILAKLGPELWQGRDPKRCPHTPRPQGVCSTERTVTLPPRKDPCPDQKGEV